MYFLPHPLSTPVELPSEKQFSDLAGSHVDSLQLCLSPDAPFLVMHYTKIVSESNRGAKFGHFQDKMRSPPAFRPLLVLQRSS